MMCGRAGKVWRKESVENDTSDHEGTACRNSWLSSDGLMGYEERIHLSRGSEFSSHVI